MRRHEEDEAAAKRRAARDRMTIGDAATLALRMRAKMPNGGELHAYEQGGRLVFAGGTRGTHSIDVYASSEARAWAHWQGYCEANGVEVGHAR